MEEVPPSKRARTRGSADARIEELISSAAPGSAASVLLVAAMEWDMGESFTSEGRPSSNYFTRLQQYVQNLHADEDRMAKELFEEYASKLDETAMEEVGYLQRSGVIDDDEEAALRSASPEDRRRILFTTLLADAEGGEEDDFGGEEDADGEENNGANDEGGEESGGEHQEEEEHAGQA